MNKKSKKIVKEEKVEDKPKQEIRSVEGINLPKKEKCDRCGNDLSKGAEYLHFPFIKLYIAFCHICIAGLKYGFYSDISRELSIFSKNRVNYE